MSDVEHDMNIAFRWVERYDLRHGHNNNNGYTACERFCMRVIMYLGADDPISIVVLLGMVVHAGAIRGHTLVYDGTPYLPVYFFSIATATAEDRVGMNAHVRRIIVRTIRRANMAHLRRMNAFASAQPAVVVIDRE